MNLSDIILQQVTKNVTGSNLQIPSNVQQQVLGGLSDSILGSLTKTATAPGGIDLIKNLLTGKSDAASSPITALAGKLFTNNILSKLNLGTVLSGGLIALIPKIFGGLKVPLRPLRVGMTQSNISIPRAMPSRMLAGVPTPIR